MVVSTNVRDFEALAGRIPATFCPLSVFVERFVRG
jgi:hypothetical protein